jgi:hypothetical protein
VALTRRDFLATSGGALALSAVALAWPPARAGAAAPIAEGDRIGARGSAGASTSIERQRRFRDGALRPVAWSRGGGAYRVVLCDGERVDIATPHAGRTRLRLDDPRARDALARALPPDALRELFTEAARLRASASRIA